MRPLEDVVAVHTLPFELPLLFPLCVPLAGNTTGAVVAFAFSGVHRSVPLESVHRYASSWAAIRNALPQGTWGGPLLNSVAFFLMCSSVNST